jgi:hypothetical protein
MTEKIHSCPWIKKCSGFFKKDINNRENGPISVHKYQQKYPIILPWMLGFFPI